MSHFFAAYGTEVPPLSAEACLYQPLGIPAAFEQRDCGIPWNQRWKGITHASTNAIFSVPGTSRILWPKMAQRIATKRGPCHSWRPFAAAAWELVKAELGTVRSPSGPGNLLTEQRGMEPARLRSQRTKTRLDQRKTEYEHTINISKWNWHDKINKMVIFEQLAGMGPY